MAHSREVRLPFLYHELVEFMFSLPARYKIRHGWTKYLIREALKGIVPEQVLWRKEKIGFAIPQAQWMSDTRVQPIVRESHDYLVREGIVNKQWPDSGAQSWEMMMAYLLLTGGESSVGWGGAEAGSFAGSTRLPSSIAGGVSTA
jgi:asparagine synthetase B (glutamine-hydrolysing)